MRCVHLYQHGKIAKTKEGKKVIWSMIPSEFFETMYFYVNIYNKCIHSKRARGLHTTLFTVLASEQSGGMEAVGKEGRLSLFTSCACVTGLIYMLI